jgi:hypothetical protein
MFFGCCLRHRRFFNPVIKGGRCLPLLFGEPKRREGLSCEIIMAYGWGRVWGCGGDLTTMRLMWGDMVQIEASGICSHAHSPQFSLCPVQLWRAVACHS